MVEKALSVHISAKEESEDQNETFIQWIKRSTWKDWIQEILFFSLVSFTYGGFFLAWLIFS